MPRTPSAATAPPPCYYVCEGWDHIFPDERQRTTRFVLDLATQPPQFHRLDLLEVFGWERLDGADWLADVMESLEHNHVLTDLDTLRAGGSLGDMTLVEREDLTDTLPDWAR